MTKVKYAIGMIILIIAIIALYAGAVYLGLYIGAHHYQETINGEGEIYGIVNQRR